LEIVANVDDIIRDGCARLARRGRRGDKWNIITMLSSDEM